MTEALFNDDAYIQECEASVISVNDRGGIILDRTVFYPTGGGQPGDQGHLVTNGIALEIATTIKGERPGEIIHVPAEGQEIPAPGDKLIARIDWKKRYLHMRMHSAMHIMCAVVPYSVTGGQIGAEKSRLDFDIADHSLDKEQITQKMNELIADNYDLRVLWITDEELDQQPELVRTMSVQPPRSAGRVRLLKIGDDIDLQPCGGTHVKNTSEIGKIRISKIENKGKKNRRINLVFDPD